MCRARPYEEPGMVVLSNLSTTRDVYETIKADHEYEVLGKFNPTYAEIEPQPSVKPESVQLQPLSSAGGFEFTQCPAYDPVATTSIHGNTNKSLDTPSIEPTTHQ